MSTNNIAGFASVLVLLLSQVACSDVNADTNFAKVSAELQKCSSYSNDIKRLSCYDRVMASNTKESGQDKSDSVAQAFNQLKKLAEVETADESLRMSLDECWLTKIRLQDENGNYPRYAIAHLNLAEVSIEKSKMSGYSSRDLVVTLNRDNVVLFYIWKDPTGSRALSPIPTLDDIRYKIARDRNLISEGKLQEHEYNTPTQDRSKGWNRKIGRTGFVHIVAKKYREDAPEIAEAFFRLVTACSA